jgi:hypothetical protein
MSEPKEKIKILVPMVKFLSTLALGVFLTLAFLFCTTNPDGFACDIPNFAAEEL